MSLNIKGSSCARCKSYLFEEDDIVFCPVCGAPHHRECYNAIGHCALEEFHGTDQEYSKVKQEPIEEKEPKTEQKNIFNEQRFIGFDFLGGVPADYQFEKDVTAEDCKKFILANTHRYIPKFIGLNKRNKVSWNWAAFLFPCGWTLSRKMYKNGIISGILILISSLLSFPFNQTVMAAMPQDNIPYPELASIIFDMLPEISGLSIALAFAGLLLELGIRIYAALFSDYNYKKFVISSIKKIKSENDDIEFEYRKKGGINPFLIIIGEMTIKFIGNFIVNLL